MRPRRKPVISSSKYDEQPRRNGSHRKVKKEIIDLDESPPPAPHPAKKKVLEALEIQFSPPRRKKVERIPEKVCPPPEYCPLDYHELCPKFFELLPKTKKDIAAMDLIKLQHDLEYLLAFATDNHHRAMGEVAFCTSGDYPIVDLSSRPVPSYFNRFVPEIDDNEYTLENLDMGKQISQCGLPVDEVVDNINLWPPPNVPTRFWKWCLESFLKPIDATFLRQFKSLFVDTTVAEEFQKLYVNEPWKHRKREKQRGRTTSNAKRKSIRNSPEVILSPPQKKKPPTRDRIYQSIANIVDVICKEELSPRSPSPPPIIIAKRVNRLKMEVFGWTNEEKTERQTWVEDLIEILEKFPDSQEWSCNFLRPMDEEEEMDAKRVGKEKMEVLSAPPVVEIPKKNYRSPRRMMSPRVKLELIDPELEDTVCKSPKLNGKLDRSPTRYSPLRKRNGEITGDWKQESPLKENGITIEENGHLEDVITVYKPQINGNGINGHRNGIEEYHLMNGIHQNGYKEKEDEERKKESVMKVAVEEELNNKNWKKQIYEMDLEYLIIREKWAPLPKRRPALKVMLEEELPCFHANKKKRNNNIKKGELIMEIDSISNSQPSTSKVKIEAEDENMVNGYMNGVEEEAEDHEISRLMNGIKKEERNEDNDDETGSERLVDYTKMISRTPDMISRPNSSLDIRPPPPSRKKTTMQVEIDNWLEYLPSDENLCTLEEKIYHGIGRKILQCLVNHKQLHEYVLSIYPFFLGHDLNVDISEEGKQSGDGDDLDEISIELLKLQEEMKQLEPDIRGTVTHCWNKVLNDFAYWETARQLDSTDITFFRLIVNTFNEFPRRFPKPNELMAIKTAMARRMEKVDLHYSDMYRKWPTFSMSTARPVDDPNDVEEFR